MLSFSLARRGIGLLAAASLALGWIPAAAAAESVTSATVKIRSFDLTKNGQVSELGAGSGTIIDSSGLILTNNHVVTDGYDEPLEAFSICLVTDPKERPACNYTASIVAQNPKLDLALLQLATKDIYGAALPSLPALSYARTELPAIDTPIVATGFPGIGGETVTSTSGTITGYEEREGVKLLKVDATISFGNSGGTATDRSGTFIGVPSAIQYDAASLGYVLPLSEARSWIDSARTGRAEPDIFALNLLAQQTRLEESIYRNRSYTSPLFPYFSVQAPEPWRIGYLDPTQLVLYSQIDGKEAYLNIDTTILPYPVTPEYMADYFEKREKNFHDYLKYQKKQKEFAGLSGYEISFERYDQQYFRTIIPVQNVLFSYEYTIPLKDGEKVAAELERLISSLTIQPSKPNTTPIEQRSYSQERPQFSIETSGQFFVNPLQYPSDVIVGIGTPDSFENTFYIAESRLPEEYRDLSSSEMLEQVLKEQWQSDDFKLVNSYPELAISGVTGFGFSFRQAGRDADQTRQGFEIWLPNGENYLNIYYSDLEENYLKNIDSVLASIATIRYDGRSGPSDLPSFRARYSDISNYIFESWINRLADKNIWIERGHFFRPESPMTRIDALNVIIDSKIFVETGRNQTATKDAFARAELAAFQDAGLNPGQQRLLGFARERGIVNGGDFFRPYEPVTLAAAMKMLCETYKLPVWEPPYPVAWHVPYIQKGISLEVLPAGMQEPGAELSRGQFAALIGAFVQVVGERDDI